MKRHILISLALGLALTGCHTFGDFSSKIFPSGNVNEPCLEGGVCNGDDLVCNTVTNMCKKKGPAAGDLDGACLEGNKCNTAALVCNTKTLQCEAVTVGDVSHVASCTADTDCASGEVCDGEVCGMPSVALTGGVGQPCGSGCNADLTCDASTVCVAACKADADCTAEGYECRDSYCQAICPSGMVFIVGGTFKMGNDCTSNEEWCMAAKPSHDVTVSDLCMDEHEFTNDDKNQPIFVGFTFPSRYIDQMNMTIDEEFNSDLRPLMYVTWQDAKNICEKQGKRLPTEAEWEYAAQSGKQYEYGTSDGTLSDTNACWKQSKTCNVKSFPKNLFGLYDMSGNVWEWVEDYYKDYDGNTTGLPSDTYRVYRGGSWSNGFSYALGVALRSAGKPGNRSDSIGFRCAKTP